MLGAIIPEPLHIPPMRNFSPVDNVDSTASSLGRVSVVSIASAASLDFFGVLSSFGIVSSINWLMVSMGSFRPIIPVDATATSSPLILRCSETLSLIW